MKPNINYDKYTDVDFSSINDNIPARVAICLYCCNVCMCATANPRKAAYQCKDTKCPLNNIKNQTMKKEHKLTETQKENFRKQLEINRSKKKNNENRDN